MGGRGGWTAVAMIVLIGCSTGATPGTPSGSPATGVAPSTGEIPILPRSVLPGYVVHGTDLDAAALSTEALDPSSFDAMLTGAGFQAGIERRFTARWKRLTEVEARVLLFRDAEGAAAYLAWVGTHGADLLGSGARASRPPPRPGAIAYIHRPCDGCAKDPFQYLAAWSRGRYVLTLLVGGPRAGPESAFALGRELDARVRTEG